MPDNNDVEYEVRMLEVNENMPGIVQAWQADGWTLIPNIPPVTIYHIVRLKNRPTAIPDAQLRMQIDDSKIGILRANGTMEAK